MGRRLAILLLLTASLLGLRAAAPLDALPPGAFTIVVLPDTQGYVGRGTKSTSTSTEPLTNPAFESHTRWIVEHRAAGEAEDRRVT